MSSRNSGFPICFFFLTKKNLVCINFVNFVQHSSLLSTSPADNSWLLYTFYCYCSIERADVAMSGIFDFFFAQIPATSLNFITH